MEPLHFGKLTIGSKNPDGEWLAVAGGGETKCAAGAILHPYVLEAIVCDDCLRLPAIDCVDRNDIGNQLSLRARGSRRFERSKTAEQIVKRPN
jgi:hypothetical protein